MNAIGQPALASPVQARPPDDFHPLEVIPYFRRWKPGTLRNVVYTFLWNCLIALVFLAIATMFRPAVVSWTLAAGYLLVANVIGYTIHLFFGLGELTRLDRLACRRGGRYRALYYTGVSMVGVVGGYATLTTAFGGYTFGGSSQPRWLVAIGISSLVISSILAAIFFARERQARAEAQLERVEREAALANLRALQAQIEPHFLFNTLANVVSLVDPDPGTAKRMLESFIRFLRASLSATRLGSTTLGDEAELIAAYLQVLQVRMGARLRYAIEVPDELRALPIAPMLLQPVVENAIVHGLEPKIDGGEIRFRAWREPGGVRIEIADTGVGFGAATRGGVGLGNLRERLALLYGGRASLEIADNRPAGARIRVSLPQ